MTSISTTNVSLATCPHCGNLHAGQCSRVKAIEYYPDGGIKRVEYFGLSDYSGLWQTQPQAVQPPYKGNSSITVT